MIPVAKTKTTADGAADAIEGDSGTERKKIFVDEAQIEAARLQVSIDRKYGNTTPEIIKEIAAVNYRP